MRKILLISPLILASFALGFMIHNGQELHEQEQAIAIAQQQFQQEALKWNTETIAGNYLAGRFAQRNFDWNAAHRFMQVNVRKDTKNELLQKRSMVVALASGHFDQAFKAAEKISKNDKDAQLAHILLAIRSFKQESYEEALSEINALGRDPVLEFFLPLFKGWAKAGKNEMDTMALRKNPLHMVHAMLIAKYLGKDSEVKKMLDQSTDLPGLQIFDLERMADLYATVGENDKAKELYERIMVLQPELSFFQEKIEDLENGKTRQPIIKSPQDGLAQGLYDTASLLYTEYSDDSATIFLELALYLNPDLADAELLLADINGRNGQYEQAITHYKSVPADHHSYASAMRRAAEYLIELDRENKAVPILEDLAQNSHNVDAQIQLGDFYRFNEDFEESIAHYNKAEEMLGGHISSDHWHLHYLRGIAYERAGNWDKAEEDLKAALTYKPNEPNVLNYLGYSWADQGKHLQESLEMIRKAVSLRPSDGYIADSLGWVYFKLERYHEAVPPLEKAVELLPYDPIINDHLGDAYWNVGRKREARFQWLRAKNNAEDGNDDLISKLDYKIQHGLVSDLEEAIKKADNERKILEAKNEAQ